jgi:hypothetical protein
MTAVKLTVFTIAMAIACVFLFRGCDEDSNLTGSVNNNDSLKKANAVLAKVNDSLLLVDKKHDTIRVEVVKRYRTIAHDTIYQICEPIVKLCDSIILIDSSQISNLKQIVKNDSTIISNYKKVSNNDSLTIVGLNKEIKKHKRHKKLLAGGLALVSAIAIIK